MPHSHTTDILEIFVYCFLNELWFLELCHRDMLSEATKLVTLKLEVIVGVCSLNIPKNTKIWRALYPLFSYLADSEVWTERVQTRMTVWKCPVHPQTACCANKGDMRDFQIPEVFKRRGKIKREHRTMMVQLGEREELHRKGKACFRWGDVFYTLDV